MLNVLCLYIHRVIIKHIKMKRRKLYPTLEAIALSDGEQRNNFKLAELLLCLCFILTTHVAIWRKSGTWGREMCVRNG